MPIYDFKCEYCGYIDSEKRLMADSSVVKVCGSCGADMNRIYDFSGYIVK